MLKFRTVFVLGAGASIPFGFQSGAAMLRAAKELTRTQLRTAINGALHHDQEVLLLDAIANTQEESLDSMLETQPVHIQAAGKRLIARRILTAESEVAAAPTRDWFSYLFSRMTEGIAARGAEGLKEFFYQNNIVFVTYNYDRLVEHKLMAGLSARYGANEGNWSDVTGRVIHLHGSVGDIHPSARLVPWGANFENGNSLDVNINAVLSWSEQSIKIVHEPKPELTNLSGREGS